MSFPANSRYQNTETLELALPDGTVVVYLARRFVPAAGSLAVMRNYRIVQGDRLDNIAARFVGDPEMFWRLCDANSAMRPGDLTATIGREIAIALPDGIPGARVV
jgi:phage tail protein X